MSYMTGIGIGNALGGLPHGLFQGEEIRRRREREDEASAMAQAEFQNRQELFGRQKKQWTAEDIAQDLYSKLQSKQITEDEFKQGMAKAGLGEKLFNYTNQQAEADMRKRQFEQQEKVGEYQLGEYARQRRAQEMMAGILGLESGQATSALMKHVNEDFSKTNPGSEIIDIKYGGKSKGDNIGLVKYKVRDGNGNIVEHVKDYEELGGLLGLPGLSQVGTNQANRNQQRIAWSMQGQAMTDARRAQAEAAFHTRRQDALKPQLDVFNRMSSDLSKLETEIAKARSGGPREELIKLYTAKKTQLDVEAAKIEPLSKGFMPDVYLDLSDNKVKSSHIREVVPEASTPGDRSRSFAYRFDDRAAFMNPGSTMLADALVKDKSSPLYADIKKRSSGKWTIPVFNAQTNQIDVIDGGENPSVSAPRIAAAKLNGFEPIVLEGIDYGHAWGLPDVSSSRKMAEDFKIQRHSTKVSGAHRGRGNGVMP